MLKLLADRTVTTTSEGGTGQEQESRLRRILRRAREFYDTYTAGLRRGDFKRLFTEETRGIYQYFGPTGEEREEKTSRFVRAARLIGRIFWGFLMALAPARRILYGIAFLLSDAKILSEWIPLRPLLKRLKFFRDLMECYFCMGIWISAALWLFLQWPSPWKREGLLYLFSGAAGAYLFDLTAHLIETKILSSFVEVQEQPEEE